MRRVSRRPWQARAALAAVPPGRYTASAALEMDGQPLTRISRSSRSPGRAPVAAAPDVAVRLPAARRAVTTAARRRSRARQLRAPVHRTTSCGVSARTWRSTAGRRRCSSESNTIRNRSATLGPHAGHPDGIGAPVTAGPHGTGRRSCPAAPARVRVRAGGQRGGERRLARLSGRDRDGRQAGRRPARPAPGALPIRRPRPRGGRRIADEGARYNIGPVSRNFNVPTTTLFFFHAGKPVAVLVPPHGRERIDNVDTVEIDFREERTPTLIMNGRRQDVPASGTLWVNPADGAVVRTRLELGEFDDAGSRRSSRSCYRKDPALGMWVPSRMTERYIGPRPWDVEGHRDDRGDLPGLQALPDVGAGSSRTRRPQRQRTAASGGATESGPTRASQ